MQKPSTLALAAAGLAALIATGAQAQNYPITPGQRSTAEQVAQAGVPLSELAPNAPDQYTIKRGDTLWRISGIFLKSPWRWPELWGMNMEEVRNPHLIYPGQVLVLEKLDGRARLRVRGEPGDERPIESVQEAPRSFFLFTRNEQTVVPATIDIVAAKDEMGIGDRLLPEPPRQFVTYAPHAPGALTAATIVSVYGDAVSIAGQNQVVLIDKGTAEGVDSGTVLAILKTGARIDDRTQDGEHASIKLPDERNGLLMVF